jgi:hypothetical protein
MRVRFKKSLRLGGLVRLNFSGSGVILGFGSRGKPVGTSRSAQRRGLALPPDISPVAHETRPWRTFLKLVLVAAIFFGGYLFGRLATSTDVQMSDPRPNDAATTAPLPPRPPAFPTPSPSTPSTAPAPDVTEPRPAKSPADSVRPSNSVKTRETQAWQVASAKPANTSAGDIRPLSSDEVRETQAWLKAFGFDPGPIDGSRGPQTRAAVRRYQAARQTEETGQIDRPLLQQVRKEGGL